MNIEAEKLELMHLLLQTQSESLLRKLKKLFEEEKDWYSNLPFEEQKEIEKGIEQANQKEVVPHKEVMKKFSKWH